MSKMVAGSIIFSLLFVLVLVVVGVVASRNSISETPTTSQSQEQGTSTTPPPPQQPESVSGSSQPVQEQLPHFSLPDVLGDDYATVNRNIGTPDETRTVAIRYGNVYNCLQWDYQNNPCPGYTMSVKFGPSVVPANASQTLDWRAGNCNKDNAHSFTICTTPDPSGTNARIKTSQIIPKELSDKHPNEIFRDSSGNAELYFKISHKKTYIVVVDATDYIIVEKTLNPKSGQFENRSHINKTSNWADQELVSFTLYDEEISRKNSGSDSDDPIEVR